MVSGGVQVVRRHEREDERAQMVVLRLRRELQRVLQVLSATTTRQMSSAVRWYTYT